MCKQEKWEGKHCYGTHDSAKRCFCIGPDNCTDKSCSLVQAHLKEHKDES